MQMNIEIGRGAKALDEGDGAGLSLGPCQPGVFDHKGREGAVDHLQHGRQELGLRGEQMPQRDGKRDDPLSYRYVRDNLLDEVGGGFRHTAGATGGTKPSPFTGEGHQFLMGTVPAAQAQKSMG